MIPDCPRCGERMHLDDETSKLVEYRCTTCNTREVETRTGRRTLRRSASDAD